MNTQTQVDFEVQEAVRWSPSLVDQQTQANYDHLKSSFDRDLVAIVRELLRDYVGIADEVVLVPVVAEGGEVFLMPGQNSERCYQWTYPGSEESVLLTAEAVGIVSTLYALQKMFWREFDHRYQDDEMDLREFANNHPESTTMFAVAFSWI
jgi:hypothetical protein